MTGRVNDTWRLLIAYANLTWIHFSQNWISVKTNETQGGSFAWNFIRFAPLCSAGWKRSQSNWIFDAATPPMAPPLCAPPARPLTADVVVGVASSSFSFPLKIGPVRRNYSKLAQRNKRIWQNHTHTHTLTHPHAPLWLGVCVCV